jgi:raffinose/stachyose/melibiose transport system permease protein
MNYHFGRGWSRSTPYLLLLPGLFFYLLIALGPSIATSIYSFTDATGIKGSVVHWIGLANYKEFLLMGQASRDNFAALGRTLIFCFFVTTIQFALGLIAALLVNQKLKGVSFFRTLYFSPVMLGVVITGLMWSLFLFPLGGPVEKLLSLFGLRSEFFGGPPPVAFTWVIVVQIWANLGTTMVIFLSGLQTIPHVTWPLLTPVVNTNLLLNTIGSLQAWQLFMVLVGYRAGTQVLGYMIFAQGFGQTSGSMVNSFRQGYAAAASMILFVLVLVIGLTMQTFLRRREEKILG